VLIVLHLPPTAPSVLPQILQRVTRAKVKHAADREPLSRGVIYVAPPDFHLLVDGLTLRLGAGARENGHRPAIDALLRSAAQSYGRHVLAILLSGMLDDGVVGLAAVRRAGGVTAVQDPREAAYPGMPDAAIDSGVVNHVLRLDELASFVATAVPDVLPPLEELVMGMDDDDHDEERASTALARPAGEVSSLTCPACGGALWEHEEGARPYYKCRTGHSYSPESLLDAQSGTIDSALWSAYRALLEPSAPTCRVGWPAGSAARVPTGRPRDMRRWSRSRRSRHSCCMMRS
jgi:two-component system chemotaxis response regulator CheB